MSDDFEDMTRSELLGRSCAEQLPKTTLVCGTCMIANELVVSVGYHQLGLCSLCGATTMVYPVIIDGEELD